MPALEDLFKTCYLTGGSGVDFSAIRLHYLGVDEVCRASGSTALTAGTVIYFRREAFALQTPAGLRLLASDGRARAVSTPATCSPGARRLSPGTASR